MSESLVNESVTSQLVSHKSTSGSLVHKKPEAFESGPGPRRAPPETQKSGSNAQKSGL